MTVHNVLTIANTGDAAMVETSAIALASAEGSGLRALCAAALFLKVRGDSKLNHNLLANAFMAVTTEKTAANYVSKAKAAAMSEWFKFTYDVNDGYAETLDAILPEFRAFWGSVNNVSRKGPPVAKTPEQIEAAKVEADAAKAEAKAAKDAAIAADGVPLSRATPEDIAQAFCNLIVAAGSPESGKRYALDSALLAEIAAGITAELETRRDEMATAPVGEMEQAAA